MRKRKRKFEEPKVAMTIRIPKSLLERFKTVVTLQKAGVSKSVAALIEESLERPRLNLSR